MTGVQCMHIASGQRLARDGSPGRESNPRPPLYESGALPAELPGRMLWRGREDSNLHPPVLETGTRYPLSYDPSQNGAWEGFALPSRGAENGANDGTRTRDLRGHIPTLFL